MAQTKCKRTRTKTPVCELCALNERRWDHVQTDRCYRICHHCMKFGHTMLFCHKLKNCVLCGKSGHNPIKCWKYCTMRRWMRRAEELGRCGECLTLFTADEKRCTNCHTYRDYWHPEPQWDCLEGDNCKETQTEENSKIIQECQT